MYDYETLMVLHPDLGEAGAKELVQRMRTVLEAGRAEIKKVDEWGMRELAYVIHKQRRGFYALIEYRCEPQAVRELERQLKLNDQVLRFVSVRQIHKKAPPPRRPRPDRDEAGGPGSETAEDLG
ncbi:MAG: 30S ribosomal protein S6 [Deltaproteobacteria bacterium]|nr:30S ribosomal protein S6 [Deltaproteobacteria bacterium]